MSGKVEVPKDLFDLLHNFCISVLKDQPTNLVGFAATYFTNLANQSQKNNSNKGVTFSKNVHSASGDSEAESDDIMDEEEMASMPARNSLGGRRLSVAAESFDPSAPDSDDEATKPSDLPPKTEEQRARLLDAIKNIFMFRCLDKKLMNRVIDAIVERPIATGEKVIVQGDDGDFFYVIESGTYEAYVNEVLKHTYDNEGFFGELALMYNTPRAASIVCTQPGVVWQLDRATFKKIVLKSAFKKRQRFENFLLNVNILGELNAYERVNVADALESRNYRDGDMIVGQGQMGSEMFFVEEGCVRVVRKGRGSTDEETELSRLKPSDYFGDVALLTRKPRVASVYAVGDTSVAVLPIDGFERLMGPCVNMMRRNLPKYREKLRELLGSEEADSIFPELVQT